MDVSCQDPVATEAEGGTAVSAMERVAKKRWRSAGAWGMRGAIKQDPLDLASEPSTKLLRRTFSRLAAAPSRRQTFGASAERGDAWWHVHVIWKHMGATISGSDRRWVNSRHDHSVWA